MRLVALTYTYVDGMLERRRPHRAEHLELIERFSAEGRLLFAGALGDPPSGALIVFTDEGSATEFTGADPYMRAGLITSHRIEPWAVATHRPLPE